MDALTDSQPTEPVVRPLRPGESTLAPDAFACVPPEAPLAMPAQRLTEFRRAERHRNVARHPAFGCWVARLLVFGGGLCLTIYGAHEMYMVVEVGGVTPLKWALVFLFVANFSWIALACMSALAGFIWHLFFAPKPSLPPVKLYITVSTQRLPDFDKRNTTPQPSPLQEPPDPPETVVP